MLLQESIGKERRPLSWVVGDQGVYRANMQSERERKRGERIAVTNLRTPGRNLICACRPGEHLRISLLK
ncbi:NADH dehydrogenase subunit B [Enterobacter asburiae]|uniref:NADH dehydrogenase subunit B n=1 Tax=Enterobacter asburiae TaxID=61645 RepID=A0A376FJ05_ENTAS|nr:NADH dehydrogenase subunit B [Enterobacter asburiae]